MPRTDITDALARLERTLRACRYGDAEATEAVQYFSRRRGLASSDLNKIAEIATTISSRLEAEKETLNQTIDETKRNLQYTLARIPKLLDGCPPADSADATEEEDDLLDDDDFPAFPRLDLPSVDLDGLDFDGDDYTSKEQVGAVSDG